MSLLVYNPNAGGGAPPVADTTLKRLVLTPDSLTGSAATSALSITQTLNTTGSPDVLLVDITNTASGANTCLIKTKIGGSNVFSVTKNATIELGSSGVAGVSAVAGGFGWMLGLAGGDVTAFPSVGVFNTGLVSRSDKSFSWASGTGLQSDARDLILRRGGAATLQLGENHVTAPVAQTIQGAGATSGNNNGGDLTLRGGAGSGSGLRGNIKLHGGNRVATIGSVNNTPFLGGGDFVSQIAVEQEISAHAIAINNILLTLASHGLMEEP